ncbi:MAG TPA: IS1595 family transposase [Rhizomicrobium sp.]|jgi:transposase-like protein|nr:IS1595 family transposase [Rhizomicrobium sp.]
MADPLNNKIFQDATKARAWLEGLLWVDGRSCGYCGVVGESTPMKGREGYYQCNACRKQFTVQVGTLFERSHIPLNKWLMAAFLLCASKKGMSAHQMHRMLGITYKSAWFMMHRLREAMRPAKDDGPKGGEGQIVEADETFIGGKEKNKHVGKRDRKKIGGSGKEIAFALVQRGGKVRSFHVPAVNAKTLRPILVQQISRNTSLMTDGAGQYRHMGEEFDRHEMVNHEADEYVRGDAHTNTVEGYFSILKRGIIGTYHHVSPQHLKRYLGEFDFRYNERSALGVDDVGRTTKALAGIVGKRLTYRRTNEAANG